MSVNRKAIIAIAIGLLLSHGVMAQAESKPGTLPESVMNAEIASINDASHFRLSDYSGKVVVLYLWAGWCGPCRFASPEINKLNKEYAARGVEVIGVVIGDRKSEAEGTLSAARKLKHNFKSGWVDEEMAKALQGERQVIPQIIIITGYGYIFKRLIGYNPTESARVLHEAVEEALVNPYSIQ